MIDTEGSILGNSVLRREDASLLRGEDRFVADMQENDVLHLAFVRSTMAHARIVEVDTSDAVEMPGVVGVFTAADLKLKPLLAVPVVSELFARPPLADEKVRFVGDIVAAVVAESLAEAVDAAEVVFADLDAIDATTDSVAATRPTAPILFEDVGTNICFESSVGSDTDPTIEAPRVVELEMVSQRLAGVPIEPNGALAIPAGDELTLWIPSQNPITVRDMLANALEMPAENLRVAAPAVGGGFGSKAGIYVEFIVVSAIARRLGRPVRWVESRSENMVAMNQGRAATMRARVGLEPDGRITGLDVELTANTGAYPVIGALLITFTQLMIQGVYDIPDLRFRAKAVVTNTTSTAAYRGAGRPEAAQILERILDVAADELDVDPAEIRRLNLLQPEAFPFTTLTGANYDTGNYQQALDAALEAAGYEELRSIQQRRRLDGDIRQLGIGLSTYVEVTAPAGLHNEFGRVDVELDGTITARVGSSAQGQGHVTSFSMILADMFGVSMDDITILQSDTAEISRGSGTVGSRSLQIAGSAIHEAGTVVLANARNLAGHLLEADPSDIVAAGGTLHVAGVPSNSLTWADLAAAAAEGGLPDGMDSGLGHELEFDSGDSTYPFGAHVSVVEVDTQTGQVKLLRHIAVDDCGRVLNPLLVTGQQHGGIAQGVSQALFEGVEYDEYGNPTTSTLADYGVPSAADLVSFETHTTESPTPRNPLGAKGIGESGTIGSTPAVHNAVVDALSHLGVRHIDMPLTARRVWQAMEDVAERS